MKLLKSGREDNSTLNEKFRSNVFMKILFLTCYNIPAHGLESWEVAALKLLQESCHAPHLYRPQLVINVFQILRPAAPWRRVNPGDHQETRSQCDDPPSDGQRGALPQGASTEAGSSPNSQGICPQNREGKSLCRERGSKGQLQEVTAGKNCCDHLVAQKLGSWRSLALVVRFGVG